MAERDEEGERSSCRFYLEISEAQAAAAELRAANPSVAIDLTVAPLGTAFALSEWQELVDEEAIDDLPEEDDELDAIFDEDDDDEDVFDEEEEEEEDPDDMFPGLETAVRGRSAGRSKRQEASGRRARPPARQRRPSGPSEALVRLQAAKGEVEAARSVLDESPVPPLLRRRNDREGPIPLFGTDALRFRMSESGEGGFESDADSDADATPELLTPLFFRREDFSAAWAASGGTAESVPPVQVTDLRTLAYQMQYDTTQDYRRMLLVAPEPAIEFVRQQQAAQEAAEPDLSDADVQGLLFGDYDGPQTPRSDPAYTNPDALE